MSYGSKSLALNSTRKQVGDFPERCWFAWLCELQEWGFVMPGSRMTESIPKSMSQKSSRALGRLTISSAALFGFMIAAVVFRDNPALDTLKSVFAPKPHLVVLNIIGAAFDQLDFDRTFVTAPECRGLTLSRGSEPTDGATYIAGMVLLDGWKWSVDGSTFEASPADAARTVCAVANHKAGRPHPANVPADQLAVAP